MLHRYVNNYMFFIFCKQMLYTYSKYIIATVQGPTGIKGELGERGEEGPMVGLYCVINLILA